MPTVTKVVDTTGIVYMRIHEQGPNGFEVLQKADPRLIPQSLPPSIPLGVDTPIAFQLVDFDGEARTDSRAVVFSIDGTLVTTNIAAGLVTLTLRPMLVEPVEISLAPQEITMDAVRLEVVA